MAQTNTKEMTFLMRRMMDYKKRILFILFFALVNTSYAQYGVGAGREVIPHRPMDSDFVRSGTGPAPTEFNVNSITDEDVAEGDEPAYEGSRAKELFKEDPNVDVLPKDKSNKVKRAE